MKNKIVAAMLALFLGSIGGHKFYLGQNGQGILYLLLCWTFIPAMIAFFEFIYLLVISEEEFNRKFNQPAMAHHPQQRLPGQGGGQMAQNITVNIPDGGERNRGRSGSSQSLTQELKALSELRTSGALTDQEFKAQKRKLLAD